VGIVEQVGAGGAASAGIVPGKRVMLFPMHGSWAERAVAPVATAMPVPDDISDATACQMIMNGFTATTLMRAALAAQSQAGLTGPLLVTAAGSSVGRNLIALAQMRGAKVVAVVRSDLGAAILRQGTAGVPVVSMERDGWAASVTAAYKQAPSVVIDPIGGGTMPMWLELMADRGTLLTYGGMDARPSTVSTVAVTSRQLTIRGVSAYGWAATASREQRAADMADVFEMARRAPQNFAGSCEFPLSKALQALSAAQASPRRGATILSSGS
jgi:NADPH:quinone reductase-like Zn-dependent oxidoreductase